MKESIGNAFLFNLAILFVIVLMAFFIGSLSYTKAAKVKNKIIEEIEKNGEIAGSEYSEVTIANEAYNNSRDEIERWLGGNDGQGIGYRVSRNGRTNCPEYRGNTSLTDANSNYEYCVYRISTCERDSDGTESRDKCGIYYHVIAYMYFDLPLVKEALL